MRYRTLVRNLVLGWLAAEWIGILIAYSFAMLVLTFFIALVLLELWTGGAWLVPIVLATCVAGLLLAWWASAIPRELIVRIRRPLGRPEWAAAWGGSTGSALLNSGWQVTSLLNRMSSIDRIARSAASADRPTPLSGSLDRLIPWDAARDRPNVSVPAPIPPLDRIGVTSHAPIRIVDLSEPPARAATPHPLRPAWRPRTPENPGRIRQA